MAYILNTSINLNQFIENVTKKKILFLNVEDINLEGKNIIIVNPKNEIENTTIDSIDSLIKNKYKKQIKRTFKFNNNNNVSYIKFEDLTVDTKGNEIKQINEEKNLKKFKKYSFNKLICIIILITIIYYFII